MDAAVPEPSEIPTHPFLIPTPNNTLAYRSTQTADLGKFILLLGDQPLLAQKVTRIDLSIVFDSVRNSGVVDVLGEMGGRDDVVVELAPLDANEYEDEKDDVSEDDEDGDLLGGEEESTSSSSSSSSSSLNNDEDEEELYVEDSKQPTCSDGYPTPSPLPASTILSTIHTVLEDFELLKTLSDISPSDTIPEDLYLQLLQSLLSVCVNVELIVLPQEWKDWWSFGTSLRL